MKAINQNNLITGLQEFVEAVSFYHYIKYGNLISHDEVCNADFMEELSEVSSLTNA